MKLQLIWITFVCPIFIFFFQIQISDWNLKMVLNPYVQCSWSKWNQRNLSKEDVKNFMCLIGCCRCWCRSWSANKIQTIRLFFFYVHLYFSACNVTYLYPISLESNSFCILYPKANDCGLDNPTYSSYGPKKPTTNEATTSSKTSLWCIFIHSSWNN